MYNSGELVVTHYDPAAGAYQKRSRENFDNKVASHPGFDKLQVVTTHVPPKKPYVAPESFDMVLTFRNLHNWLSRDAMQEVMEEASKHIENGTKKVLLNLSKSNIVNSIGASIIIELIEKLQQVDGILSFCELPSIIEKTFKIMGLTKYCDTYESQEAALEQLV